MNITFLLRTYKRRKISTEDSYQQQQRDDDNSSKVSECPVTVVDSGYAPHCTIANGSATAAPSNATKVMEVPNNLLTHNQINETTSAPSAPPSTPSTHTPRVLKSFPKRSPSQAQNLD